MTTRLYVGNLSLESTSDDLYSLFGQVSRVLAVEISTRPNNGRSRGFGFVEIEAASVKDVIFKMSFTDLDGRTLNVQETRPRFW